MGIGINAQVITLGLDQAELLEVATGNDTLLCKTHSVVLGEEFTASGGSGEYFYSWYPNVFLDDHTSANPTCTPEETTTYLLTVTDSKGCTTIGYVTVAVDPCLGINDIINTSDILIYPNPVSERFAISGLPTGSYDIEIKLMNQLGQIVYSERLYSNSVEKTIELNSNQHLDPGIYLLHLRYGKQVIVKTIHII